MSLAQRESKPLGEFAARALTERIKQDATKLYELLLDAYQGKAWAALRYTNWREYCQTEFDMSQSRAYQILDQGRVTLALREASNSTMVEISEREARDVAPILEEVAQNVRARITPDLPKERAKQIVREEVEKARRISSAKRGAKELMDELNPPDFDPEANRDRILRVADFKDALDRVLSLPPAAELIPAFRPYQHEYVKALPAAIERLVAFQAEWEKVNG